MTAIGICNGNISIIMIKDGVVEAYEPLNDCLAKLPLQKLPEFELDF